MSRLREVTESVFDAQVALAMAIASLNVPVISLPVRYNMPNNSMLEEQHREVEHAVILHLWENQIRRVEAFASLASIQAFLERTDLGPVNRLAQEVIREFYPAMMAEERVAASAA